MRKEESKKKREEKDERVNGDRANGDRAGDRVAERHEERRERKERPAIEALKRRDRSEAVGAFCTRVLERETVVCEGPRV